MGGNPKDSPWRSTPRTARKRKGIELTLSDEARERLEELALERQQLRSTVVEDLIMTAKRKK